MENFNKETPTLFELKFSIHIALSQSAQTKKVSEFKF